MQPPDPINIGRSWIAAARRIVVLTGAGISTDSGIPDYRGPHGVCVAPVAKEAGTRIVIVNNQPTPMDPLADARLRGPIGEVLPALCVAHAA
jgi:NAD-dependent SIR2 family protein deacetylase